MLRKQYREAKCIDYLQAQLREAAAGRYFMHVKPKVSPHLFREPVHKPKVFIRMIRTDQCRVSNEQDFQQALLSADILLAQSTSRITGGRVNAVTYLQRQGFLRPCTAC